MLRLHQIELLGFKSFPNKTTVDFDSGVTCIVGPNGSGKSNVADAINFAFGSQSGKELRARRLSSLIFAGTDQIRALNLASVTLYFERTAVDFNSEDEDLFGSFSFNLEDELELPELSIATSPVGSKLAEEGGYTGTSLTNHRSATEHKQVDRTPEVIKQLEELKPGDRISVTRRVFRDGTGGYFINGEAVRLKDIDSLFTRYNLGRNAVFSISQGEVEKKILETPQEMRQWLAEATGVANLLNQKTRAQVKLKRTERNLERLEDIRRTTRELVTDLAAQRKVAEEHLKLAGELRAVELNECKREIEFAQKQQESSGKALGELTGELARAREAQQAKLIKLTDHKQSMGETETRLAESIEAQESQRSQVAQLNQQAAVAAEARASADRELAATRTDEADLNEQVEAIERELSANTETTTEAQTELAGAQEAEASATRTREGAQTQLTELTDRLSTISNETFEAAREVARLLNELESNRRTGKQLAGQLQERDQREELLGQRLTELEGELTKEQRQAEELALKVGEGRDALEQHKTQIAELQQTIASHEQNIVRQRSELAELVSRRATIAELADSAGKAALGPTALLAAAELAGRLNRVGELAFPAELRPAFTRLLAHLGDTLIGKRELRQSALELLAHEETEAMLLHPLGNVELHADSLWHRAEGDPAVIASLAGRLGDVLTAGTLAEADTLLNGNPGVQAVVLRDGSALLGRGYSYLGQPDPQEALKVAQGSDLANLDLQISELRIQVDLADAELAGHRQQLAQTQWERDEASSQLAAAEARLNSAVALSDRLHGAVAERREELTLLNRQSELLSADQTKLATSLPETERQLAETEQRQTELQQQSQQLKEQRLIAEGRLDEAREQLSAVVARSGLSRQRVKHLEQAGFDLAERRNNIRHKLTKLGERIAALLAGQKDSVSQQETADQRASELTAHLASSSDSLAQLRDERARQAAAYEQLQQEFSEAGQGVARLEQNEISAAATRERSTERLAEWLDDLKERFGLTLTELLNDPQIRVSPPDAALDASEAGRGKLREEKARLKAELELLGPVNLLAIDQHQEHATRLEFLDTQAEDLSRAVADLEELITDLDRTTEKRYRASLRRIESRFNEIYLKLFGSGWARLRFDEPDDIINSGVEIEVLLPGSRRHSLRSLSGGQRSLIFLALFFSVHSVRSPGFCILDEADAALDDANVERFVSLIRETSRDEQFIVITHNKMTMETADKLIGVVGRPKGVSNILSVNLKEARKMAE